MKTNHLPDDAVEGSRKTTDDLQLLQSDFGAVLDRIGYEDGSYLYALKDGKPESFEARSLPVGALELPYFSYRVAEDWPEGITGWCVQAAVVAPWFGRHGGATQVLFFDERDALVSVEDLLKVGVITVEQ